MGIHLIGMYLIGVYLTGVHLTDVHLIGVHLLQACISYRRASYRRASHRRVSHGRASLIGVHPVDHPVLVSSHLINCDGTGERQVEGDAVVLCPQLVPETRDIRWTLLPIIFQWRWNFDSVFVAFICAS
jgi:hypothetical protein